MNNNIDIRKFSVLYQLNDAILLEYIYTNHTINNQIELGLNENSISLFKINDGDNINTNYNKDFVIYGDLNDNSYDRDNLYLRINKDKIKLPSGEDNVNNLVTNINTDLLGSVYYFDTIKLHFINGFDFYNRTYDGLSLNVFLNTTYNNKLNLANYIFINKTNRHQTILNKNPLYFNEREFTRYLEFKIISPRKLNLDSRNLIDSNDIITCKNDLLSTITKNSNDICESVINNGFINFKLSYIKEDDNNTSIFNEVDSIEFDLKDKDNNDFLGAYIKEIDKFNYIEFSGMYNGNFENLDEFISYNNNRGNDYILMHNLVIKEAIVNNNENDVYWNITDKIEISQTSDFNTPLIYRPILRGKNLFDAIIDYSVCFYNRLNNTQTWKFSTISLNQYNNIGSYYKEVDNSLRIKNLNLQQPHKIFNKIEEKKIEIINNIEEHDILNLNYINKTSLVSDINLVVNTNNMFDLKQLNNKNDIITNNNLHHKNRLRLLINDSTSYIRFNFFNYINEDKTNLSISPFIVDNYNNIQLIFTNNYGNDFIINSITDNKEIIENKNSNSIIFKLNESDALKILQFDNKSFKIKIETKLNEHFSDFETLANGKFYSQDEYDKYLTEDVLEMYRKLADEYKKLSDEFDKIKK